MKRKKFIKYFSVFMALNILFEVVSPTVALALTNGPLQPEFTGFEPAGSSEMVDLFTGDFKYNIPLMDVEGYPLNLAYHAGVNMESEASWVGLGWSLNPGVMNRMVKGLPDDFNGDGIKSTTRMKPHIGKGIGFQTKIGASQSGEWGNGLGDEVGGGGANIGLEGNVALTYNNYKGYGLDFQLDGHASLSAGIPLHSHGQIAGGIGLGISSQEGGTFSKHGTIGFGSPFYVNSIGGGTSVNTRTGATFNTHMKGVSGSFAGYGLSYTSSHTLPVGSFAYSPSIGKNYIGSGYGYSLKGGLWTCSPFNQTVYSVIFGFKGYTNISAIESDEVTLPGYGYTYLENAGDNAIMDFNRTRDGVVAKETPNLSMANLTYDIFSASGQGMGSNFRAMRNDVGVVHDNVTTNEGEQTAGGLEIGIGGIFYTSIDAMKMTNKGKSGLWKTDLTNNLKFIASNSNASPSQQYYEKLCYKQLGEMTIRESDAYIGDEAVISPTMQPNGLGYNAGSNLPYANSNYLARSQREKRVNNIITLSGKEAEDYGFGKIHLYTKNTFSIDANQRSVASETPVISRTTKSATDDIKDHYSEISITKTDGSKYYYGIPVYNMKRERVTFNCSDRLESPYSGNGYPVNSYTYTALPKTYTYQMVQYTNAELTTNLRGSDNMFQKEETPKYPSSFLLTAIVSPDYVDVTGDGPSYDDLGTYTKFNYSKEESNFKWRDPYTVSSNATYTFTTPPEKHAHLNQGLLSDELDDKGFFEYGEREVYYLHSVETKNYVAVFTLGNRNDAKDVSNSDGSIPGSSNARKLEKIQLYSKSELIASGITNAVPIKSVHFNYDAAYPLCPGTFNSSAGKLTLKSLYFTYGNSEKAALSPYEFFYADNNHDGTMDANFNYHPVAVDRWGSYKPNLNNIPSGSTLSLNNAEDPYAIQIETDADLHAAAWNLTDIITPTGAKISITYEADDYAYVQYEQAGRMLKIHDIQSSINTSADVPGTYTGNSDIRNSDYVIVNMEGLRTGITSSVSFSDATEIVRKEIFRSDQPDLELYFRCFTELAGPDHSWGLNSSYNDFVPGYSQIEDAGVFTSTVSNNTFTRTIDGNTNTYYKYAYVKLRKKNAFNTTEVNPICLAGWQFTRTYLPRVAYPGSEPANMGDNTEKPLQQLSSIMVGMGSAFTDMVNGMNDKPNKRFYNKKFSSKIYYNKSFVRAYVPNKDKIGGGHRVKEIKINDQWTDATGSAEQNSFYGQVYDYTTTETTNDGISDGKVISSGVASYEPIVGGEENSMHQPFPFNMEKKMAPNDNHYQETPLAEMFYPAPVVGYSKVTVRNITTEYAGSNKTPQIGKTEFEFYTAKDFPVIEEHTSVTKQNFENEIIDALTVIKTAYSIFHATQGHTVKLNDMHGKLKAVKTFGEDNSKAPISGNTYYYKKKPGPNKGFELVTTAPAVNESGAGATLSSRYIDVTVDARENINESTTLGTQLTFELSACSGIGIHPGVITGSTEFGIRLATNTKMIQQYGILDSVASFDYKSQTVSKNLTWDGVTGTPLLSSSTNGFNQTVYNMTYPAHWMYSRLSGEGKRIGLTSPLNGTTWDISTGVIDRSQVDTYELVVPGDEVVLYDITGNLFGTRYWVTEKGSSAGAGGYNYHLLDAGGTVLNQTTVPTLTASTYYIKVVRPAERNQTSFSSGFVTTTKTQPSFTNSAQTSTSNVIASGATEFCQYWNPYEFNSATQSYTTGIGQVIPMACLPTAMTPTSNNIFNPYTGGYLGRWHPLKNYVFNTPRTYTTQPNVKDDGVYSSFTPFWTNSGGDWSTNPWTDGWNRWIVNSENVVYSPEGNLLETRDAIGIPHSQRLTFNHTMPVTQASNAHVSETGFESFEEYAHIYPSLNYLSPSALFANDHLNLYNKINQSGGAYTQSVTAHTGRYSLAFTSTTSPLTYSCTMSNIDYVSLNEPLTPSTSLIPFAKCSAAGVDPIDHPPISNDFLHDKKYLISFWVKGNTAATDYSGTFSVAVNYTVPSSSITNGSLFPVVNSSPVINGWQKFDYVFTTPAYGPAINQPNTLTFKITPLAGFYLDDFRLQPFNANMTCISYDPVHLRPWAILDDRNYATYLEYDNQGILVRKKKETEKGIYTLQESRSSTVKK